MTKLESRLKVYVTSWCPDCRNVKRFLDAHNIEYDEIDIDRDGEAEALVIRVSGGRRIIPMIDTGAKFLFNPPLSALAKECF